MDITELGVSGKRIKQKYHVNQLTLFCLLIFNVDLIRHINLVVSSLDS